MPRSCPLSPPVLQRGKPSISRSRSLRPRSFQKNGGSDENIAREGHRGRDYRGYGGSCILGVRRRSGTQVRKPLFQKTQGKVNRHRGRQGQGCLRQGDSGGSCKAQVGLRQLRVRGRGGGLHVSLYLQEKAVVQAEQRKDPLGTHRMGKARVLLP